MTNYYKTRQQQWDEVMQSFKDAEERTKICKEMFGQENLYGLTEEQKELYWNKIYSTL